MEKLVGLSRTLSLASFEVSHAFAAPEDRPNAVNTLRDPILARWGGAGLLKVRNDRRRAGIRRGALDQRNQGGPQQDGYSPLVQGAIPEVPRQLRIDFTFEVVLIQRIIRRGADNSLEHRPERSLALVGEEILFFRDELWS